MRTEEILKDLRDCGGFHNHHKWTKKEVAQWVMTNYDCTYYVAKRVASYIYKN